LRFSADDLVALLTVDPAAELRFRARAVDPGWGRLYGGQVLAQSLAAAEATVPASRLVHSMHAYFLRPGHVRTPLDLEVDTIRDGRSFTTRRVVARQAGEAILNLSASFQAPESGLEHADAMPEVVGPEHLEAVRHGPFEARTLHPYHQDAPVAQPPVKQTWFRLTEPLSDDPALHRRLLAWALDSHFLTAATHPHAISWVTPGIQLASLDHAMWIHRDLRVDGWLLYDVVSPSLSSSRGLVFGRVFTQDGRHVASATQEGLIRDRR